MTKWLLCKLRLLCLAVASLLPLAAPVHAEKRVALMIGNNDYRNVPKLQKAINDARTMGDANAIPANAQPYLKLSPTAQFVSVELTYRDGSVSEIKSFRR
jgi:hypothetical protein